MHDVCVYIFSFVLVTAMCMSLCTMQVQRSTDKLVCCSSPSKYFETKSPVVCHCVQQDNWPTISKETRKNKIVTEGMYFFLFHSWNMFILSSHWDESKRQEARAVVEED